MKHSWSTAVWGGRARRHWADLGCTQLPRAHAGSPTPPLISIQFLLSILYTFAYSCIMIITWYSHWLYDIPIQFPSNKLPYLIVPTPSWPWPGPMSCPGPGRRPGGFDPPQHPGLRTGRRRRRAAGAGPSTARGGDRGGDGAELRATKVSSELGRTGDVGSKGRGWKFLFLLCVCFFFVWVMSSEDLIVKWGSENVEKPTGSPGSRDFGTKTVEVSQCFTDTRPVLHAKQLFSSTCLGQQVVSQLVIGVWFYVFQFHLYFIFNTPWQVAAHLPFFACFSSWFGWNHSLSQLLLEGLPVSWAWCCRTANFKSLKPKARSRCGKRWRTEGWEGSGFAKKWGISRDLPWFCHDLPQLMAMTSREEWSKNIYHHISTNLVINWLVHDFERDAATTWFFFVWTVSVSSFWVRTTNQLSEVSWTSRPLGSHFLRKKCRFPDHNHLDGESLCSDLEIKFHHHVQSFWMILTMCKFENHMNPHIHLLKQFDMGSTHHESRSCSYS